MYVNPFHTIPSCFFKIHYDIIVLSVLRSPKCVRSVIPAKILYKFVFIYLVSDNMYVKVAIQDSTVGIATR
jgi:hypothetical protein